MGSIGEESDNYVPQTTESLTELDKVSVNLEIEERGPFMNDKKEEFMTKVVVVDEKEYRVPLTVLRDLKEIRKEKPDLEFFKVTSNGTGLKTRYTVIAL